MDQDLWLKTVHILYSSFAHVTKTKFHCTLTIIKLYIPPSSEKYNSFHIHNSSKKAQFQKAYNALHSHSLIKNPSMDFAFEKALMAPTHIRTHTSTHIFSSSLFHKWPAKWFCSNLPLH